VAGKKDATGREFCRGLSLCPLLVVRPMQNGMPICSMSDAERAWGKLVALYKTVRPDGYTQEPERTLSLDELVPAMLLFVLLTRITRMVAMRP
jgi:hypothetical protein